MYVRFLLVQYHTLIGAMPPTTKNITYINGVQVYRRPLNEWDWNNVLSLRTEEMKVLTNWSHVSFLKPAFLLNRQRKR